MTRRPPSSPLFPYTTLSRSGTATPGESPRRMNSGIAPGVPTPSVMIRSEEHTSELQSQSKLLFPLFFFNDAAPPEFSPLPLHDALPIGPRHARRESKKDEFRNRARRADAERDD